jgi:hypothetical protein
MPLFCVYRRSDGLSGLGVVCVVSGLVYPAILLCVCVEVFYSVVCDADCFRVLYL